MGLDILSSAAPADKVRLTHEAAAAWRAGHLAGPGRETPPDRPARPDRPALLPPNAMPRRTTGGPAGRTALLHALAHIELNAIDLAWDILCRFPDADMPGAFYDDWVAVAADEALHFGLLADLLTELGSEYGALPAHDGLWQAAEKTADDLMARLAIVPMTLEARGLDTTPVTIARMTRNGDTTAVPALERIAEDEIRHVAVGVRWFVHLAERRRLDPAATWHALLDRHFPNGLKPPFNHDARARAGFPRAWYEGAVKTAGGPPGYGAPEG